MAGQTHRTDPTEKGAYDPRHPVPVLVVVEPPSAGALFVVSETRMLLGRDPDCDIFLDDAKVSRRHAQLDRRDARGPHPATRITVTDLGSTNGTWVNGVRLGGPRVLNTHDKLRIGHSVMVFSQRDEQELAAEQHVIRLATTDALTGLANRRNLNQQLRREFVRAERYGWPLSVLMIDIDHFKRFNDVHGHETGDRVLEAVAGAINEHVRARDIACRHGGEEFVVVLPHTDPREALDIATRIHEAVAGIELPGCEPVTASIGVATLGVEHASPEALLDCADRAMYVAKRTGRNRICYPGMVTQGD